MLVATLFDRYVHMPKTDDEWEVRGFLENYEFSCFAAWDGIHVYVSSKLKNYFSFKKRYIVINLGLLGQNMRFLYAGVGAPGSIHDLFYKRTECRMSKLKYIIMACILLYNLCICVHDPCKPR